MGNPPAGRAQKGPPPTLSKHDMVMTEGQPVFLGDEKVTAVAIPGHTPRSMGLIFAVKDGGKTHMAAYMGERFDPNPFVVGRANYQKFLDVMSQCMDAQIARRKE